ncbi:MAG: CDP-diacylglycerol--glycerol-3-phosphate 3-phosphatidyltransferase [Bacteroidetes bacterium]|nr:MAG: CDP-diacylglycerol--glycerol-3-phosphate 3-phosphatidyltransferase [Bacteroidota bacterium]MBZ0195388.1 CDP-diacylglycerol--glycerol-3-phosphate 3-phosphatidyltransferase [Candidatus Kapabacteria bacterium]
MNLTFANILTLTRLFLAPIVLALAVAGTPLTVSLACITFIAAALTDWLDGYLARAYGQVTDMGAYLDPLADKVLTISAIVTFYIIGIMPLWMVLVNVIRDFVVTALRNIAEERGTSVKTTRLAKWKTALQMVVIISVLFLYWLSITDPGFELSGMVLGTTTDIVSILYSKLVWWMLLVLTVYTLITGIDYTVRYRNLLSRPT